MTKRICERCGKPFFGSNKKHFCLTCSVENYNERRREQNQRRKERKKLEQEDIK